MEPLHRGDILSGTVAAVERFGVFVALDEGPAHPLFPGIGFIVGPEPSWRHISAPSDVVRVGRHVSCEFLQFDTYDAEAGLSLKALEPDPLRAFADRTAVGRGSVLRNRPRVSGRTAVAERPRPSGQRRPEPRQGPRLMRAVRDRVRGRG
ncbi:S1 RNA-binding domain-containing protein [Streptomyces sp. NE5-10]|uniref:S1 RNA-binding domain-containing protein n=1 Tax=Streptomyces sp. NE5-10 TaxID=2759674 RepID=UPI0027DC7536|nr:S1 RNA-binding domain-containing protein [Streptomyces sp. NE5-10]